MKVAATAIAQLSANSTKVNALFPLEDDDSLYQLDKSNSASWELRSNPADANSPKYKYLTRILQGNESPRQILRWKSDVAKVLLGLAANNLASAKPIIEAMMRPQILAQFQAMLQVQAQNRYDAALVTAQQADQAAGNTVASDAVRHNGVDHYRIVDHLTDGINHVITNLLPRKCLAKVKRSLRRDMRKPADMRVRPYWLALQRINDEDLPALPPFGGNTQRLSDDEILDILLYGTPKSWQKEMDRQGFDPMEKQLFEVVDFMENIEVSEDKPMIKVENKKVSSSKKKASSSPKKKAPFFCREHGPNYTHDTKDCRTLANKPAEKTSSYKNKTWNRKAAESSDAAKKELAALVTKTVKKQLASTDKKRKSGDDGECFLLDTITSDLDGFNYEEMEKLTISNDNDNSEPDIDEVSV